MSDFPYCPLCGNVNRADLGPVTGTCLDGRACRRRQAGVEPVNPDPAVPEITDADAMVLRMLAGASFSGSATVILPSGIHLDAALAAAWTEAYRETPDA